jgi:uncharacterized protein DUF4190
MSYGPPPSYPSGNDPYGGGQPGWRPPGPYRDDSQATTALVLGIVGLVVCELVAPFALVIGRNSMRRIDQSGGQLGGRGKAQAGFVMGLIGTVLLAIGIVVVIALAASNGSSSG